MGEIDRDTKVKTEKGRFRLIYPRRVQEQNRALTALNGLDVSPVHLTLEVYGLILKFEVHLLL